MSFPLGVSGQFAQCQFKGKVTFAPYEKFYLDLVRAGFATASRSTSLNARVSPSRLGNFSPFPFFLKPNCLSFMYLC
jgi:hypothetical protein